MILILLVPKPLAELCFASVRDGSGNTHIRGFLFVDADMLQTIKEDNVKGSMFDQGYAPLKYTEQSALKAFRYRMEQRNTPDVNPASLLTIEWTAEQALYLIMKMFLEFDHRKHPNPGYKVWGTIDRDCVQMAEVIA